MRTSLKSGGVALLATVGIAAGALGATAPASAAPGQPGPGQNQPGQNQPGPNKPGPNQPGPNKPGPNQPGPNQPPPPAGPGDLALSGGVNCYWKGWGPNWDNLPGWRMHRWMEVRNIGGSTMTNVTVTEFGGSTKTVAIPHQPFGVLRPGQAYRAFDTTWRGCWPSSIGGYTIGAQVENPFNNWGFWRNDLQQPGNRTPLPQR